jgi:peptide methionine sulfoxide reductase msrA/msrB
MRTKKIVFLFLWLIGFLPFTGCSQQPDSLTKKKISIMKKLTPEEERVIIHKGTEMPFTGEYTDLFEEGIYSCKQCGSELYFSNSKFHSGCGWPSFDQEIPGKVSKKLDADGRRTEILCANCGGHLGHVFYGEGFTNKDTRHCVNSISMEFTPKNLSVKPKLEEAIFAGGCFWGVEYYFQKEKGVVKTEVGYIGGHKVNPTYREVCNHTTGHIEAMKVTFDPSKTSYETLAKLFFEIHDPTQTNGQGNDIGEQYLSMVFYKNQEQKEITEKLISILTQKGYKIATKLKEATHFWPAETYHQQYYEKNGGVPYCHSKVMRF